MDSKVNLLRICSKSFLLLFKIMFNLTPEISVIFDLTQNGSSAVRE